MNFNCSSLHILVKGTKKHFDYQIISEKAKNRVHAVHDTHDTSRIEKTFWKIDRQLRTPGEPVCNIMHYNH